MSNLEIGRAAKLTFPVRHATQPISLGTDGHAQNARGGQTIYIPKWFRDYIQLWPSNASTMYKKNKYHSRCTTQPIIEYAEWDI